MPDDRQDHPSGAATGPRVLLLTGGHRVDHEALLGMVGALAAERGWRWAHAVQPTALDWLRPGTPWDVLLCHDLPGLHLRRGEPPAPRGPSPEVVAALSALLARGRRPGRDAPRPGRLARVGRLGRRPRRPLPVRARTAARRAVALVRHADHLLHGATASPRDTRSARASTRWR